jgi:hypothetical protein
MAFSPLSFLIGVGIGWATPIVARSSRALAVELAVAGMTMVDELRRVMAEQVEAFEDIAAEARARREELIARAEADDLGGEEDESEAREGEAHDGGEAADDQAQPTGRGRRRGSARRTVGATNGAR